MKKYFKYTIMFIVINLFLLSDIKAETAGVTYFGQSEKDAANVGCTTDACASDVKYSGLRITLIDKYGNVVNNTTTVNFWSSNDAAKFANGNISSIAVSPTNTYKCSENYYNKKGTGITKYANTSLNIGLQDVVGSNPSYLLPSAWVENKVKSTNSITIAKTIIASLTTNTSDSASSINLANYENYFFKVEPIYIIKENYFSFCNYYTGTSYEIKNLWKTIYNYSFGGYYVSGGCNSTIDGSWNVIRNYSVVLYYPCSEKDKGGPNVACYDSSKWGDLSTYKSEGMHTQSGTCKFIDSKNPVDYFNINIYNSAGANGIGVGYFKVSIFRGAIQITKTDESGNQLSGAKFNLYSDDKCSTLYKGDIKVDGTATIDNLSVGTYSIKEIQSPSNYELDSTCHIIKVEAGKTAKKTVENIRKVEKSISILKKDPSGNYITSDDVTITLYSGNTNCIDNGNNTKPYKFNKIQKITLQPGEYSIKETEAPDGYKLDSTCHAVLIPESGPPEIDDRVKTLLTITNYKKGCEDDLNSYIATYGKSSIPSTKLIELFNKYKGTSAFPTDPPYGLLDFDNPTCSVERSCTDFNVGCLSAKHTNIDFNEKNLSCFDSYKTDSNGNYVGFCRKNLTLTNALGVSKFYSNSGKFLIKYVAEDNYIYYYSLEDAAKNKLKLQKSAANLVAYSTNTQTCYYIGGNENEPALDPTGLEVYFGGRDLNESPEKLSKTLWDFEVYGPYEVNNLKLIVYQEGHYFQLKDIYLNKITGKTTNNTFATEKITGIVSPFNTRSGVIPFNLKYDGETYSSNACTYQTFEEIIDTKLELEFRTVDTTNPFSGEVASCRNTNANWCDGNDCSCDNDVVKNTIQKRVNSYGLKEGNRQNPIYKITLTPNDIKQIRKYNKENKYDNYIMMTINKSGTKKYVNKFLYELFNKKITLNGTTETTQAKLEGEIKERDAEPSTPSVPAINLPKPTPPTIPNVQQTPTTPPSETESTTYVPKVYTDSSGNLDTIKSKMSGYNSISSGKHKFELNLDSKLKSCVGYNQNISVSGTTTTWTANDTCKIDLSKLAPAPANKKDINRYYYTYSVTLENGKTYKSCMRVAVYYSGLILNRDAELKHDNCCLDSNFGEWHKNNC